jgi:hypothetical protein
MKKLLILTVLTAVHLHFGAPARAADDYTVHEWGTFTSVQGADGVQLAWNPLTVSELPKFVYSRKNPGKDMPNGLVSYLGSKDMLRTLQRMETPVIYFYSDREQIVDVTVRFPQGSVTEWYPQITAEARGSSNVMSGLRTIRWDQVKLHPRQRGGALETLLPKDPSGSHYYAAREAESDFLQISPGPAGQGTETEQFLFYRGVGDFQAPLRVTQTGADASSVRLENTGTEELRHLFVSTVKGTQAKFIFVPELAPGGSRVVKLAPGQGLTALSDVRAQLAAELRTALGTEGLFPAEAKAMVDTWDDSWFAEPGVRVLYTLPRAWTDRTLPLTLNPRPRDVVRVMVGRAELITPSMEWELMKQITRYSDGNSAVRAQAITDTRNLGLGRFLEPAAHRLESHVPVPELAVAARALIGEASKPSGKGLAAK